MDRRVRADVAVLITVLIGLAACGVGVAEKSLLVDTVPGEGVPEFGHMFVIVGENMEADQLTEANSPYLLGTVEPMSAWFTDYYAVTHHSLANYIALTSGQFTACEQADGLPAECHQGIDNLFRQFDTAGVSWNLWAESMPVPCALADAGSRDSLNPYSTDHNPAIYYDGIEGRTGVWSAADVSAECLANVRPAGSTGPNDLSALDAALAVGNLSRFNFIVPNECEDGHSACPPASNRALQFDDFLAREVPRILSSPAFGRDGVLVIVYDEGTTGHFNLRDRFGRGGHVVLALVSPLVRPGMYGGRFDHYSLLRMWEDGFRLDGFLGNAARAGAIRSVWMA